MAEQFDLPRGVSSRARVKRDVQREFFLQVALVNRNSVALLFRGGQSRELKLSCARVAIVLSLMRLRCMLLSSDEHLHSILCRPRDPQTNNPVDDADDEPNEDKDNDGDDDDDTRRKFRSKLLQPSRKNASSSESSARPRTPPPMMVRTRGQMQMLTRDGA